MSLLSVARNPLSSAQSRTAGQEGRVGQGSASILGADRLDLGASAGRLEAVRGQMLQVLADNDRDRTDILEVMSLLMPATYPDPEDAAGEDPRITRMMMALALSTEARAAIQKSMEALRHAEAGVPMPSGRSARAEAQQHIEAALERQTMLQHEMGALQKDLHDSPFGRPSPAEEKALRVVNRTMLGLDDTARRMARISDALVEAHPGR